MSAKYQLHQFDLFYFVLAWTGSSSLPRRSVVAEYYEQQKDFDGVCIDITSDVRNCGGIFFTCINKNGLASCSNGVCDIVCRPGYLKNANGRCVIVDTISDVSTLVLFSSSLIGPSHRIALRSLRRAKLMRCL